MWHEELGLPENALILDFGPCPWCGREEVKVAQNGMAALRHPPDACCVHGAIAAASRLRAALQGRLSPQERAEVEGELRKIMASLSRMGRDREELARAAREVGEQYPVPVINAILSALAERGAR